MEKNLFVGLAQGDDLTGEKGSNTVFVLTHDEIARIPKEKTVTYARVVPDYRPQKEDPYRIRITAGGNLIKKRQWSSQQEQPT